MFESPISLFLLLLLINFYGPKYMDNSFSMTGFLSFAPSGFFLGLTSDEIVPKNPRPVTNPKAFFEKD